MKKYTLTCMILAAAVFASGLSACSLREKGAADSGAAEQAEQNTNAESSVTGSGTTENNTQTENNSAQENSTAAPPVSTGNVRELTGEELEEFETFVNQGNYGFLLSDYEAPEYMDLNQVFYDGAGIEVTPLSAEEEKAFLAATKSDEIITDVIRLTKSQIEQYLLERAGIGLKDIKTKFFWTYVPEYDSYYNEHGDTNYTKFICESGIETNGVWKVRARGTLLSSGDYICEVSAKKAEHGGFQFLSNDIIKDDWWITENQAGVDTMAGLRKLTAAYQKSKGFPDNTYNRSIFDSDMRFYTKEELEEINSKLYPVFRNEIYARHGYVFKNEDWNEFFRPYTWYRSEYGADIFDQSCFNEFEAVNLQLIMELEQQ